MTIIINATPAQETLGLLNLDKLNEMSTVQNELNKKFIGPNWINEKKPPFPLAFIAEFGEFLGHIEQTWKWWKKPTPLSQTQKDQAFLEIVDCCHFFLSEFMEEFQSEKHAASFLLGLNETFQAYNRGEEHVEVSLLQDIANCFGQQAVVNLHMLGSVIADCCVICGKAPADLHKWYCGKAALNNLRQDMGDKVGTYIKQWPEVGEDNLYLEQLMNSKDYNSITEIYEDLKTKYKEVALEWLANNPL